MKRITTLTGPSAAGKSTLEKMMVEQGCLKAVSVTTRAMRTGEVDGVDYYFVSKDKFKAMQELDMFVECLQFGEHFYGLSTAELARLFMMGDHVVLVCEPYGAEQIQKYCQKRTDIELTSVFIDNPLSVITERFIKRATEDVMRAAVDPHQDYEKVLAGYASRMVIMMTQEHAWRMAAYAPIPGGLHYDVVFQTFDASNEKTVLNALLGRVEVLA